MELAVLVSLVMYFIPSIIGFIRGHASKWGIFALNLFLGWTMILWLVALIWSLSNKGASQNVTVINNMNNSNN